MFSLISSVKKYISVKNDTLEIDMSFLRNLLPENSKFLKVSLVNMPPVSLSSDKDLEINSKHLVLSCSEGVDELGSVYKVHLNPSNEDYSRVGLGDIAVHSLEVDLEVERLREQLVEECEHSCVVPSTKDEYLRIVQDLEKRLTALEISRSNV